MSISRMQGALALLATCVAAPAGASPLYDLTCLDCKGMPYVEANGMNGAGVVAGRWGNVAAILDHGRHRLLGTLGGRDSWANAINDAKVVVGGSERFGAPATFHAFAWQGGVMTDLGAFGIRGSTEAYAVNNLGQIVGIAWLDGTQVSHSFLYEDGVLKDLGVPPGAISPNNVALAINDRSHIVGEARFAADGDPNCYLYADGVWTDLGNLGGYTSECYPAAVNVHDVVVGDSSVRTPDGHGRAHGFAWRRGTMIDLGLLPGADVDGFSAATGINDAGQIVGWSDTTPGGDRVAFLIDGREMIDLNTRLAASGAGWHIYQAIAINGTGEILAFGARGGEGHNVLLRPVP